MRRRWLRGVATALAAVALAVGAGVASAPPSEAYTLTGCKWPSGNITWTRAPGITGNISTALPAAQSGWNPTSVNVSQLGTGGQIYASVYSNSGDGLDGRSSWECTSGGTTVLATAQINTANTGSRSVNQLRAVWTHEFGHAIGLGHGATNQVVMYTCPRCYYDATGLYIPRNDDKAGANFLY